MKIAHVVCVFAPYHGGIGTAAYNFAGLSAEYGHEVTVFTPKYERKTQDPNCVFKIARLRPYLKRGNAALIPGLFNKLNAFDIVHLHYPFYGGMEIVYLASKFLGKKFKLVIHFHMDTLDLSPVNRVFGWPSELIKKSLFRMADGISCASLDYVRSSSLKIFYNTWPQKFMEIPFGVDTNDFAAKQSEAPEKNILFVGGLDRAHKFKGIRILLEAFSKIRQKAKLIIVGDGALRPYYEKIAANLEVSSRVYFTGNVNKQELVKRYQDASVLVLPSVNSHEAFGIVLLEAMSCGTTVLASDLPGVREVFNDGREGHLFEAGDSLALCRKLDLILENNDRRKTMGLAARRLAEQKYDWQIIGRQLEKIYRQINPYENMLDQ